MELTILGSGGCMVIPRPLCRCRICKEARLKGVPYSRTGPSAFLRDDNLLIDTPAEIVAQLNRSGIERIDYLLFTHLDPDHVEGFRVVEQITLDFRTWEAYAGQGIRLIIPEVLHARLRTIQSQYGPLLDYYEDRGFISSSPFLDTVRLGTLRIKAIPVERGTQTSFVYVFEQGQKKMVYAPCDIKPFPETRREVRNADLLVIQQGIFEDGLRRDFRYPADHISRTTLYTFEETMALGKRIDAGQILFMHLEEYWNRSFEDYLAIEKMHDNIQFAFDGMHMTV